MKTKNIIKIITIILLVAMLLTNFITVSQATENTETSIGTINPDNFKPGNLTATDTADAFTKAGTIVKAFIYVGMVISIVMFMVLGMKYMMGSIEERAEYKKTLVPMLVGTLLIFASGTIVSIIWSIMEKVNT